MTLRLKSLIYLVVAAALTACGGGEKSSSTGWNYNDQEWGGFEKLDYEGQATGPNLVLIEGGTFSMGTTEENVTYEWDNIPRRVTISSFYMDETEVRNIDYREYLHWIEGVFDESYPEVLNSALPDTLVWREELSFNEPYVETYFRHPSYDEYPVVGVNWVQANEFCKWRTDRVNEMVLIEKGIINLNPEQQDAENFNTEAYLLGQYEPSVRKNLEDKRTGGERNVKFEDGILLPSYRLPTEAEWEYAALALKGNQINEDERVSDRRIYAWSGKSMRYQVRDKYQGQMLANFKRGRGDYMGISGKLNDNAPIPAPVRSFIPNDFGLYQMSGNVNEWTADLYRPLTSMTLRGVEDHDLNPYRGGVFEERILDEDGRAVEKDSLGRIKYREIPDTATIDRENYRTAHVYDFLDGDEVSEVEYDYGETTLINDKSRVIKGGGFADRAYWLSPGTRRHMQEDHSSRNVGFRCAMTRTGSPQGNDFQGGNEFGKKMKPKKRKYK